MNDFNQTLQLYLLLISRRAGKSIWIRVCMHTTLPGMCHFCTRLCLEDELFYQLILLRIRYGILHVYTEQEHPVNVVEPFYHMAFTTLCLMQRTCEEEMLVMDDAV